jgi:hypothetical protein
MSNYPPFTRPAFSQALEAWETVLSQRGYPEGILWIFDENLCFELDPQSKAGFKMGYQVRFSPTPPDAEQIAYDHFCEFEAPIVFYRIGSAGGKSVCLLLCDEWFEKFGEPQGYLRRDEWRVAFRPGGNEQIEEITDKQRWQQRIIRDRPLHDLDFCMTLRGVHEILAHGRVLTPYEQYALKFLDAWRRLLHPQSGE